MGPTGRLVTIKRSGVDGPHFPLSLSTCLFGRGIECDIRIQLPVVSKQHCKIEISGQEAILCNFSSTNPTQVNGSVIAEPVHLRHGDVITIVDRSFRYENESHRNGSESTEFSGKKGKQESLHRVSRSSFSSDPDGKVQDSNTRSKLCEENVSGSPLVHVKIGKAAGAVLDGPKDHAARKTLNAVRSSELSGENYRNAMDPAAEVFKEDSGVPLVSSHGEPKTFPSTWCPENSGNHESPFRKLYESMKEEFDVKSEKGNVLQSGKKSGSWSHRVSENECSGGLQDGTQVLVSLKSRPRSGRFTPMKTDPALGERGISQTEDRRKDEDALQTPKETMGPSIPPKGMTRTKTPLPHSPRNSSRKRRSEDVRVPSGSEPLSLAPRESFGTDNETFTPWKFLTRNQTPTKVENADKFGAIPKLFSQKRGSVPTGVDILATESETRNHAVLAPLPIQVKRKIQNISVHQPEKVGATAGPSSSGLPGRSSVDSSNFDDSIHKTEGTPLKRRRVSFGGRLKPELFDENLPPNTPLKRGETPRSSLVSHTPPVLKKIIKEYPQPSRKETSSEICLEVSAQDQWKGSPSRNLTETSPVAKDARRRSCKAPSVLVSSGSTSPHPADIPKRAGRKSGPLPSKRASIDRSQHEILQRIYSRRRSGASEANLIVAKSWADVVKLGAKQTQAKVVKHGPQRQLSKRHRRTNTPKKPVSDVHSQSSTGHANSPCTIIIGKAHIEKVHVPARPYRMLNNLVFNKKMDFNEDLSGLTEMFKTPAKGKPQTVSLCPNAFSNSEDFLGKEFQVPNSGEKPPLGTSANFGENVFPVTQNKPQEPSDHSPASPALRRPAIRGNANIEKTPGLEAEPLKPASSASRFRRSAELGNTQMPGPGHRDEEANTGTAGNTSGRRLRKTPQRGQKPEGVAEDRESCFDPCEKAIKSEGSSDKMAAVRRSRRYSEQRWDPVADLTTLKRQQDIEPKEDLGGIQGLPQTPTHTQEPMNVGNKTAEKCQKSSKPELLSMPTRMDIELKTPLQKADPEEEPSALRKATQMPEESIPSHGEPGGGDEGISLFKETPKQKVDPAENVTGSRRRSRTPKRNAPSLEDLAGLRELFQTPEHADKPRTDSKTTTVPGKSPLAEAVNTPASRKRRLKTPPQKVDLEEEPSALRKATPTPRKAKPSHGEPGGWDEGISLFKETPKQKRNPAENVTRSRGRSRTPKRNAPSLEDLAGLRELFQTPEHTQHPVTDDTTTTVPGKSPVDTPSKRRHLKTPLQKVDLEEEPSALRKASRTPGESVPSHGEQGDGQEDIKLFDRTPKQKRNPAENVTGSRRRSRTPKRNGPSLEDLAGLRELFQTPEHADKPRTDGKTTTVPGKSPLADPVNTPSRRRRLETPPQKVDLEEEPSALRKATPTPRKAKPSHGEPGGGDEGISLFKETPKQKRNPTENVTRSRGQSRTPKRNGPSLEDLAGLRELFQTPEHADKPRTDGKTTTVPSESPLAEPVNTPSKRRWLETPPQKADLEEEPSALRKASRTPGESVPSHGQQGDGQEDITLFDRTPKQKRNPAENVTGSRGRSRTPKRNGPSLEDLAGLRELFQTPEHADKPRTDGKTTTVPCRSPLADPFDTPTSKRRRLETPPQKVDLEEEPSALRKATPALGESTHSPREPGGGGEDVKLSKETPKKKLDRVENVSRSKKQVRTDKEKAQFLEDLVGFKELFRTPERTQDPSAVVKSAVMPSQSPLVEMVSAPTHRKRCLKTPLGKAGLEKELVPPGEPTQMPGEAARTHGEPGGGDEGVRLFKETPKQKRNPAENVTGSRRRSRTPKRNAPSLEDPAGLRELFQSPEHTQHPVTDDTTTTVPGKSPLADPVHKPASRRRRLKTPPQRADIEREPSALRTSTRRRGESALARREAARPDGDIKPLNKAAKQKVDSAENVTGSRRRLKAPPQRADVVQEPSALRTSTQRREESALAREEAAGEGGDIRLVNKTAKQTLSPAESGMPRKSRLRAPKEKAQPPEDRASFKAPSPAPDHSEEAGKDRGGIKGAPVRSPDGREAVNVLQRGLRARRVIANEDLGGRREPVAPGREGGVSLPAKRKRGTEEGSTGAKRLRCTTPARDAAEEKPPQKRRRAAPSEGCDPPAPPTMKERLRVVAERMELLGDLPRSSREAKARGREAARKTPPHQGRSLRSRRPNKTGEEEQRPQPVVTAAEKPTRKRSDKKPLKTSQETTSQSPEDRGKNPASGGKAHESRMCLRSARLTKIPSPDVAKEKQREKRVSVQEKKQEEEVRQPSDPMRLRSRKITVPPGGKSLESKPQQRVTRNAKRCAENIKKDDDNVCIRKLRTRSRRDNEDI